MTQAKIRLAFEVDGLMGNEYPYVEIDDNTPKLATLITQPHLAPGVCRGDVLMLSDEAPEVTKAFAYNAEGEVVEDGTVLCYEVAGIVSKSGRASLLVPPTEAAKSNPISLMSFQDEVKAATKALFEDAPDSYTLNWQMGCFNLTLEPDVAEYKRVLAVLKVLETIKAVDECEVMDLGEKEGNDELDIKPYPYVKLH